MDALPTEPGGGAFPLIEPVCIGKCPADWVWVIDRLWFGNPSLEGAVELDVEVRFERQS
jgi:hypothetical protein